MPSLFQVTEDDIKHLERQDFHELCHILVLQEAKRLGLGPLAVSSNLEISADGGEDVRIRWQGGVEPDVNGYIPSRWCLFQVKAENQFGPQRCVNELFSGPKVLKPMIEENFRGRGAYIVFVRQSINPSRKDARIKEMRKALKNRRKAYSKAKLLIYDRNRITEWVNNHLPAVEFVQVKLGRANPSGLRSWKGLEAFPEMQNPWRVTNDQTLIIDRLREELAATHAVIRLTGMAGLGKTRIALEAFRADGSNVHQMLLSSGFVYYDADGEKRSDVVDSLIPVFERGTTGILVVDNCPPELHNRLKREVGHGNCSVSLLTLSALPDGSQSDVQMQRFSEDELRNVVRAKYTLLPDHTVARLCSVSGGNVFVALELASMAMRDPSAAIAFSNHEIIGRLLKRVYDPASEEQHILGVLALFEQVECEREDGEETELDFLSSKIIHVSSAAVERALRSFKGTGCVRREGDYLSVEPYPLALGLASEVLRTLEPRTVRQLMGGAGVPGRLHKSHIDRLSQLGWTVEGPALVAEQVRPGGPFDQAEVVLSEQGSRLFQAFVQVNPEECLKLLERTVGPLPTETLLNSKAQYKLLFILEKLAWHASLFVRAAWLLHALAKDNSTHLGAQSQRSFLTLFHVFLPGTQANLDSRREVIHKLLASTDYTDRALGVAALGASLHAFQFGRMGGVEEQGGRLPQDDYRPDPLELQSYWRESLSTLADIATQEGNELSAKARETFAASMVGVALKGMVSEVAQQGARIASQLDGQGWSSGRDALRRIVATLGKDNVAGELLHDLDRQMEPTTLEAKLFEFISKPSWWDYDEDYNRSREIVEERARELAKEIAPNPTDFFEKINLIQTGEQRQAFTFGEQLIRTLSDPETLVKRSLDGLRELDRKVSNTGFLAGIMKVCQATFPELRRRTLEDLQSDPQFGWLAIPIILGGTISMQDLDRLLEHVQNSHFPVTDLRILAYGSVLSHLSPEDVASFALRLLQFGCTGAVVSLDILAMFRHGRGPMPGIDSALRSVLTSSPILSCPTFDNQESGYHWSQIASALLDDQSETGIATAVTNDIVAYATGDQRMYAIDHTVEPVLRALVEKHRDISWPIIGSVILSGGKGAWELLNLFDNDHFQGNTKHGILYYLGYDYFLEWCDRNPEALGRFARHIPVLQVTDGRWSVEELAIKFIERFGSDKAVLDEFSAGMWSFGWSGSPLPQYEAMKSFAESFVGSVNPVTAAWARENLATVVSSISREVKRRQNEAIGVYDW